MRINGKRRDQKSIRRQNGERSLKYVMDLSAMHNYVLYRLSNNFYRIFLCCCFCRCSLHNDSLDKSCCFPLRYHRLFSAIIAFVIFILCPELWFGTSIVTFYVLLFLVASFVYCRCCCCFWCCLCERANVSASVSVSVSVNERECILGRIGRYFKIYICRVVLTNIAYC